MSVLHTVIGATHHVLSSLVTMGGQMVCACVYYQSVCCICKIELWFVQFKLHSLTSPASSLFRAFGPTSNRFEGEVSLGPHHPPAFLPFTSVHTHAHMCLTNMLDGKC